MVMSTVIMTARGDDPLFLICVVNFFAGSERCSMQSAVVEATGDDATSGCECKVRTRAVRVARARGAWRVRVRVRVRLHMRKPARTTTHRALSETE